MKDELTNRREFLGTLALGAGAAVCPRVFGAVSPKCNYGALLHLGSNMWGDFSEDPGQYAQSAEEEKIRPNPVNPGGKSKVSYHSYLQCRDDLWKELVDRAAERGLNQIFIDLGEGVEYPSHPELKVPGTWSVEKLRKELARMRGLGLEPIPKLNFSTCHDAWLKEYHRMVSTKTYYQVVADVIRDVCEVFDRPRYFHLGFDEETPAAVKNRAMAVIRQGDLWWHDFNYCVREVERNGARAMLWSDMICAGKETFLKRMSKDVVQMPWYYGTDFSEKNVTWDASFEKKTDWSVQRNLAASIGVLCDAGYDVIPCTSNWSNAKASESMVAYCRDRVPVRRLKGFLTAPWFMTLACQRQKLEEGIRLFADAKRKLYPAKA